MSRESEDKIATLRAQLKRQKALTEYALKKWEHFMDRAHFAEEMLDLAMEEGLRQLEEERRK